MARKRLERAATGRTILVVDDNREFLATTEAMIAREGHRVIATDRPLDALAMLRRAPVDLVLVDFFMPEMTGEAFVRELRTFDPLAQVILQTGYASEQPARQMLARLDIQGYFDKNDGPDKQLLWVDVGLRASATVRSLEASRLGLRYILGATPDLHRMQPLEELLQGILIQTAGLLGAIDAFVAIAPPVPDGFVALDGNGGRLEVRAATGRFQAGMRVDQLGPLAGTTLPLVVGELELGAIYLDRAIAGARDRELLAILANQAAVAIHNAQLYQMAAFDPLTGAYTRRFFEHALLRELRSVHRFRAPMTMLLVDVDELKQLNDRGGHVTGDHALAAIGRALRGAIRATDILGRYGGDEFAVALPGTGADGAAVVVRRILDAIAALRVDGQPVSASLGVGVLAPPPPDAPPSPIAAEHLSSLGHALLATADAGLYAAKRAGRAQAGATLELPWAEALAIAPPRGYAVEATA